MNLEAAHGIGARAGDVAIEPARRRVRVMAGGACVGDSNNAVLVFERGIIVGTPLERPDTKWAHGGPNASSLLASDGPWDPTSERT